MKTSETIDDYNNLLKILNVKNKQFEQFEMFLMIFRESKSQGKTRSII